MESFAEWLQRLPDSPVVYGGIGFIIAQLWGTRDRLRNLKLRLMRIERVLAELEKKAR